MKQPTRDQVRPLSRRLALLATATALVAASLGPGGSPAAADPAHASPGGTSTTGWYLALGDSLAAGYQPGAPFDLDGGYVGDVLDSVRAGAPQTKLRNLACPGEDSTEMITGGGGCSYEEGSQLAQALVFLRAHADTTRLVTLTIGSNDVTPCMNPAESPVTIQGCLVRRLGVADPTQPPPAGSLAGNLDSVLRELHQAAPTAQVVVTNYYDPYLASWLQGPAGRDLAVFSTYLQGSVNAVIDAAATRNSAATADVAGAFETGNWSPTTLTLPGGTVTTPTNVARICQLTWMCLVGNIHPNDAGYDVIAAAVAAKLS